MNEDSAVPRSGNQLQDADIATAVLGESLPSSPGNGSADYLDLTRLIRQQGLFLRIGKGREELHACVIFSKTSHE